MVPPGINVLTTGGQDHPEEPAVATSGSGLQEMKIVLLAFDGAFGTRASSTVTLPQIRASGNERMKAVVLWHRPDHNFRPDNKRCIEDFMFERPNLGRIHETVSQITRLKPVSTADMRPCNTYGDSGHTVIL